MVFTAPDWVPPLPFGMFSPLAWRGWLADVAIDPPDSISIAEFMSNEKYGRAPLSESRSPYTCGFTGKTYSAAEVVKREDLMARAIGKRLGFDLREGTEWDRVVGLYSVNTVG